FSGSTKVRSKPMSSTAPPSSGSVSQIITSVLTAHRAKAANSTTSISTWHCTTHTNPQQGGMSHCVSLHCKVNLIFRMCHLFSCLMLTVLWLCKFSVLIFNS
uniref:Uncharacterized protein n=1 Tax=Junco hyemalis TaxID=40217 RepID=A0A8C5IF22_JUNHY